MSRNKSTQDFLRLLNENLRENPIWRNLFTNISKTIDAYVTERIDQFAQIRDPQHVHRGDYLTTPLGRGRVVHVDRQYDDTNELIDEIHVNIHNVGNVVVPFRSIHERSVLINGTRSIGFDYFSDSLSDEDYARIYRYIGEYWPESYGTRFVDFMGFIKNTRFEIEQLWTKDKGDFATSDDVEIRKYDYLEPNHGDSLPVYGPLSSEPILNKQDIDSGFADYPTAHVALNYDLNYTPENLSQDDFNDIICLFYFLAPIHLVLQRISASTDIEIPFYSNRGRSPQFHWYETAFLALSDEYVQIPAATFPSVYSVFPDGHVYTQVEHEGDDVEHEGDLVWAPVI